MGWRANTVRPYILYMAKLAFFDTLGANNVRPYSLYGGEKAVDDPEAQIGRISTECGAGGVDPIIPGHTAAAAPS